MIIDEGYYTTDQTIRILQIGSIEGVQRLVRKGLLHPKNSITRKSKKWLFKGQDIHNCIADRDNNIKYSFILNK